VRLSFHRIHISFSSSSHGTSPEPPHRALLEEPNDGEAGVPVEDGGEGEPVEVGPGVEHDLILLLVAAALQLAAPYRMAPSYHTATTPPGAVMWAPLLAAVTATAANA
jgi:hypothetical protein